MCAGHCARHGGYKVSIAKSPNISCYKLGVFLGKLHTQSNS